MKKLILYKSVIGTIMGALVAYLAVKGIIGEAEVILISTILVSLGLGGSHYTAKNYEKKDLPTKK